MILVRYHGEIHTKAPKTRKRFIRILLSNIEDACYLNRKNCRISERRGRIFIKGWKDDLSPLTKVFGIHSISPVVKESFSSLEELVEKGEKYFKELVKGKEFAVRVKRTGIHPFSSQDVERELGARLIKYGKVNLTSPEFTASVEIRDKNIYFFSSKIKGAGGLPIGTEGKGVALLSGGFDSAVASWYGLKRGIMVHYLFCNLGGEVHQEAAFKVAKSLSSQWGYGYRPLFYAINFQEVLKELQNKTSSKYWQILLKRLMYRAAERVANLIGANAIITGESIGQVSSQTLQNLGVIENAVAIQVIRPLAGMDKEEIINLSRSIGTYELSSTVKEYCSIVPEYPATKATLEEIMEEEKKFNQDCFEKALAQLQSFDIRTKKRERLLPSLEVKEILLDTILVDLREEKEFERWHPSGALNLPFEIALIEFSKLEKKFHYTLYCEHGTKSIQLARMMQEKGYTAFSLKGGVKTLKKLLKAQV